ncbi:hypothetical protein D5952_21595 [Salmonella enterica subsp. enterica]|nr:hypothetical protein [Salmonella enterica subsp. enterica serovar Bonn]MLZ42475.1 hypothetical protein [Salmonella enterica subsp. enterica serovar Bonn]
MGEPFDRETLETTRDIIRETMPENVAVALLISIFPDYMRSENIPSVTVLFIFTLTIICIERWISFSVINYLSALRFKRKKTSFIIFTLWLFLFPVLRFHKYLYKKPHHSGPY